MNDWSTDPARVLAAVPAERYAGFTVLDGFGVPDDGFETWKFERWRSTRGKALAFASRLADALERFKPSAVVLGIPLADVAACQAMRAEAKRLLGAVPTVERRVAEGRQLILGKYVGSTETEFSDRIVTGFLPELKRFAGRAANVIQYRRHAFEAAALALVEVVERAPTSAIALAQPEAFATGTFSTTVARNVRRVRPES
jgi:hypothetical protein